MLNLTEGIFLKWGKGIKKCIATFLCTAIAITGVPGINAFANEMKDIYSQGFSETIEIEDVTYTYNYYYNENGERSISISDSTKSKSDVISYSEKTSTIYLDGEKIGDTKITDDNDNILDTTESKANWKLIGTSHLYVSWVKGISAASLAGVLAVAMGGVPVSGIIASCGLTVLGVIAGGSIGGTLHWTRWYYTSLLYYHYKYDWAFVDPTGKRHGTFYLYFNLE